MTTRKNEKDRQRLEMRASDILDPNSQIGVKLRSLYAADPFHFSVSSSIVTLLCYRPFCHVALSLS